MTAIEANLSHKRVVLGLCGGIAAYKVCEIASTLAKAGIQVDPVLTEQAQQFITPLTLATLCRQAAYTDQDFWSPTQARPLHIELGERADLIILAPLTANTLAKLAHGLADNLLTNIVLASNCPVLLVPAMNTDMWLQGSVQRNWQMLLADSRYHALEPGTGRLACDRVGQGRMAEPTNVLAITDSLLLTGGQRDLTGQHLLISAGSTREYIDAVRFIGNPSSGKMGVALAQAAQHRGATVTLVHGPMVTEHLAGTTGIECIPITRASEMQAAMMAQLPKSDWILMAAAVADVKPRDRAVSKLPKSALPEALPLASVPDILTHLGKIKLPHQVMIGFAAQTGEVIPPAVEKLRSKGLDVIVANPIDQAESGFGSEFNQAILIDKSERQVKVPHCPKRHLAHQIYDFILSRRPLEED
ncbi:MAG: bifunctional phosphopantothenoylcysteine decarboxylase/phosphopantothenate--cysteine ligase CoaBC [Cyanobacteria bacterium J06638_28]